MVDKAMDDPEELAVRALSFLAGDPTQLSRFLDSTGWTPESIAVPESRHALLVTALDYLMQGEDLLLTFAANTGINPGDVAIAYRKLSGDAAMPGV